MRDGPRHRYHRPEPPIAGFSTELAQHGSGDKGASARAAVSSKHRIDKADQRRRVSGSGCVAQTGRACSPARRSDSYALELASRPQSGQREQGRRPRRRVARRRHPHVEDDRSSEIDDSTSRRRLRHVNERSPREGVTAMLDAAARASADGPSAFTATWRRCRVVVRRRGGGEAPEEFVDVAGKNGTFSSIGGRQC